jgi:2-keto-3-deoxy-L-rhamnonate aldolase RhmA
VSVVVRPTMRERLAAGETLVGTFLGLGSGVAAEACGHAGLDWVLVDLEHGAGGEESLPAQLLGARAAGVHGLVRVATAERIRACRALDLGAEGVMFPMIDTVEQARACAAALRHSPAGTRGVAGYHRGAGYGLDPDAVADQDERTLGIVQVESPDAVAASPELAAIEGIDVLFVGPSDLSYAMGIPGEIEHPDFRAAIARVVEAARAAGKAAGIMTGAPAAIRGAADDGFRMIACSTDLGLMVDAVRDVAAALEEEGNRMP